MKYSDLFKIFVGLIIRRIYDKHIESFYIDPNNNKSLDNDFDGDDPDTIILIKYLTWHIKFGKHSKHKKQLSKKLILVA